LEEDDESSDEEDDQSSSAHDKVSKSSLPQDSIIDLFYDGGMRSIANAVCFKVMNKYPEYLSSDTPVGMRGPSWALHLTRKGKAPANATLEEYVKTMDACFRVMHGMDVDRESHVIKRFRDEIIQKYPYIEPEVATAFGQVRLRVRIRGLNRRDKYLQAQRKEEKRIRKEELAKRKAERKSRSLVKGACATKRRAAASPSSTARKKKKLLPKETRAHKKNKDYVS
jgi:hypothetical protein